MRAEMSGKRNAKSLVVNFRLSPEQYETLRQACHAAGEKNIGSFARLTVLFWLERHKERTDSLQDDIDLLRARLVDLDLAFREFINRRLQKSRPSEPST